MQRKGHRSKEVCTLCLNNHLPLMHYPFPFLTLIALALTTSFETNAQQLPAYPDPNKCYVRCVEWDTYETFLDSVLVYTEEDAMIYPHEEMEYVLAPEIKRWEANRLEGCESDDPSDCTVVGHKIYPAETITFLIPKDTSLGNPYWDVFEVQELARKGGFSHYEEIDCPLTYYNVLPFNYQMGSAALSADALDVIDDILLNLLSDYPKLRIQINAHTASPGSAVSNLNLTELRAKGIADYLVSRGINRERLLTRGFGESQLKNRCTDGVKCSEAEHAVNRRVEFRVLNVDW